MNRSSVRFRQAAPPATCDFAPLARFAPGDPAYREIEATLAAQPAIPVSAVTLDGQADGNFPATDGTASAHHLTGPRVPREVPDAGHNLPQESPVSFVDSILEVSRLDALKEGAGR